MLKTILWRFICCNKKKSYLTVFEKSCKICKSRSFSAYIGQFDLLRAIQAKWRLDMLKVILWRFICCEKKKSYQTVFEKIGPKCWKGPFLPKKGHKKAQKDSIKIPKNTSWGIDLNNHLPKFEENPSDGFWDTAWNGPTDGPMEGRRTQTHDIRLRPIGR